MGQKLAIGAPPPDTQGSALASACRHEKSCNRSLASLALFQVLIFRLRLLSVFPAVFGGPGLRGSGGPGRHPAASASLLALLALPSQGRGPRRQKTREDLLRDVVGRRRRASRMVSRTVRTHSRTRD